MYIGCVDTAVAGVP